MERKILPISVSPTLAKSIEDAADGNVSGYIKKAIKFFLDFGLNDERLEKLKDVADKENRPLSNTVTNIVVEHVDKVRYFKTFK